MRLILRGLVAGASMAAVCTLSPVHAATKPFPAPTGFKASTSNPSSITYVWTAVPKAPAYRLKISRKSSMKSATEVVSKTASFVASGLKPGTPYYAQVRVVSADNSTKLSDKSGVLTAATKPGASATPTPTPTPTSTTPTPPPAPGGFRVAANNGRGVVLDWIGVRGAAGYRLQLARLVTMADGVETPFLTTYGSVYGLAHDRKYFARVRAVNGSGQPFGAWSKQIAFLTPKAPPAPTKPALTIASFNVRCANCYTGQNQEKPWSTRRSAVVAQIVSRKPDVIGIQEASQAALKGTNASQFDDLGTRLRAAGVPYYVTNSDRAASQGTRVFYNSATVQLIAQGYKLLPSCKGCNRRYTSWGIFKQKSTGQSFFLATVHDQYLPQYARLRQQEIQVMMAEVAKRNPNHLPAFVTGDFNSTRYQSPTNAPYDEVIKAGFVDPLGHTPKSASVSAKATVENRIRANYNSHNNFIRTVAKFAEWQNGSNIDYIFTTPMRVLLWETVLNLDKSDHIVGTIPSDHNMVLIKAVLP